MIAILRRRLAILAFLAALIALVLPAAASATSYSFAVNNTGNGEGEVSCKVTEPGEELREGEFCDGPWPANTRITFEAPIPETGSQFVGFQNGTGSAATCSSKKSCSFKLEADSSIEVRFDLIVRTLNVNYPGEGIGEVEVEVDECPVAECEIAESSYPGGVEYTYPKGAELTLVPQVFLPSEFFAGWSGGAGSAAACAGTAPCTFSLEQSSSITALFELIELTVQKQGSGQGTVSSESGEIECGSTCSAPSEEGEEVVLTATATTGSTFAGWSGCESNPAPDECVVTLGAESATVTATFDLVQHQLSVTKSGAGSGTVSSTPTGIGCGATCSAAFAEGTTVTLKATPASGSTFAGWSAGTGSAAGCTGTTTSCAFTIEADSSVTATFDLTAKPKSTLTVTKSGAGSGTVSSTPTGIGCGATCSAAFAEGTTVTLKATPASGSTFAGWSAGTGSAAGCTGTTTSCAFTIEADSSVTATFDRKERPPSEEETTPPPLVGVARAAPAALVRTGKALLKLTCTGGGPCKGSFKLKAKVKKGGKRRNLVIGKASFSLAAGTSKTIRVRLSSPAKQELAKGKTIKAKLSGTGNQSRTVKLKPASRR